MEITAGARGKELVNNAQAIGPDGLASNTAQASIQLREELFRDRAFVMGRVVEGDCATPTPQLKGVAGVRVYLEDGRYSITDDEGKYHFEDVMPGSHVVQMDTVTIPETHEARICVDRVRNAGRAWSQFVDVRGGALWRTDFVLQRQPVPSGRVTCSSKRPSAVDSVASHAKLNIRETAHQRKRACMLMLPEGLEYQRGSARLNDRCTRRSAASSENVLTFALDDVARRHAGDS